MSTGPRSRRGHGPGNLPLGGLAGALVTVRTWAARGRAAPGAAAEAEAEAEAEADGAREGEAPPEVVPAGPAPPPPPAAHERPSATPAPAPVPPAAPAYPLAPAHPPAPAPVPYPVPAPVPVAYPAPAAPVPADELAEVAVWRGYVKAQFYAQPIVRGAPEPYALALSPLFRPKGRPLADTPAAREALDRLVATMETLGWAPTGAGPEWYRVRLRRPGGVPTSVSTV